MVKKKIFIGTAWPYVNGDLHIGHLAGYLIPADIFSRYSRLRGYQTLMVSGSDCHGTPITFEADKRKISPKELVNEYHPKIVNLIKAYDITYDIFTSTITQNHKKVTQEFFINLLKNGYILKVKTKQYFSTQENRFLPDRYVEGDCFYCQAKEQRGDQCESCGRNLEPGELKNPKSRLTGSEVILKETEHYALDFSKLQKRLEHYIRSSSHWRKWVLKETIGFINEGLKPRIITRDLNWGVKIPQNKIKRRFLIKNLNRKRFYVWFEAVIGYFSATVEWSKKNNRSWQEFWLDPGCRHYYFMGKDNLIFHTIFWPGQLLGQEKGYNLPYFPAVNNFLLLEGKKFSKSRGVHVDSFEIAKKYGVDNVRFYLTSILPENKDSNFHWQEFTKTINNELVDKIGNFIYRVLSFYKNKLNSKIENQKLDNEVIKNSENTFQKVTERLEKVEIVTAFNSILNYVHFANQYLDRKKPWQKETKEAEEIIFNSLQIINSLRLLLWLIIPSKINELDEILNLEKIKPQENVDSFKFRKLDPQLIKIINLKPIFHKINF